MEKENTRSIPQNMSVRQVQDTVQQTIDLRDIWFLIKKHIIVILASLLACTVAGFGVSKLETKSYTSKATMFVSYEAQTTIAVSTAYSFSKYMADTFVVFLTEDLVLDKTAESIANDQYMDIDYNGDGEIERFENPYFGKKSSARSLLSSGASAALADDTLIINVSFTASGDSGDKISQYAINKLVNKAVEVADETNEDGTAKYGLMKGSLRVISEGKKGSLSSKTTRDTMIGMAVGAVIAAAYVFVRYFTDTRFKDAEEIERTLGIPVLAGIPEYEFSEDDEKKGGK